MDKMSFQFHYPTFYTFQEVLEVHKQCLSALTVTFRKVWLICNLAHQCYFICHLTCSKTEQPRTVPVECFGGRSCRGAVR